jgi:hypothetical protein
MVITRVKDLISGKRPDISPRKAATPVAAPAAAPPAASTEDYLERLDAAFASRDAAAPRAPVEEHAPDPPTTVDLSSELAQWSPPSPANVPDEPRAIETLGDVSALFESESASPRHVPDVAAPVAAPVQMSAPAVNLADAFEALLAAEEGKPLESRAVQAIASSDAFVEQVTRLVIERLGDRAMRDVVLDVAERLVREEIERIKSQTR